MRDSGNRRPYNRIYLSVRHKLLLALLVSSAWTLLCTWIALPWIQDLRTVFGLPLTLAIVTGVALIPGWANAFLICGLLIDRRPLYLHHDTLPGVSILVAAYNEQAYIRETIDSVLKQRYPGPVEIIVIDDGSQDRTAAIVSAMFSEVEKRPGFSLSLLRQQPNAGKAAALNLGLSKARHQVVVSLDADSYLYGQALTNLVTNLVDAPPRTAAVAGTVLVRNSRDNILTRLQEWDYFLGIAVVKRIQSLYQGTLVAQGAFSAYQRSALEEVGGWSRTVGEDIVLTWALHEHGYRISYAENAFAFTNVPDSYRQFFLQRKRWARGLFEAFKRHASLLWRPRLITPFVYLNAIFPFLDAAFLFAFVPGVVAALFFHNYLLVGVMTLYLLPLMLLINTIMFLHQRRIFIRYGLQIRKNGLGLLLYMLSYQLLMAPASLSGYLAELLNTNKNWGTKSVSRGLENAPHVKAHPEPHAVRTKKPQHLV